MKISFKHFFGQQTQLDLNASVACLECEPSEESQALDQGWLISNGNWIQCRSTRLQLNQGILDLLWDDRFTWTTIPTTDIDALQAVYDDYLAHKCFAKNFDLLSDAERTEWLLVYNHDRLVAFTKLLVFNGGLLSDTNAYAYDVRQYGLGKKMLALEAHLANKQNLEYLYIGPGYEVACIYKAFLPGFEWWTGDSWSGDVDKYKRLCQSDSDINNLSQLATAYKNCLDS